MSAPKKPRMKRWSLGLDARTMRNLNMKAKAHGVSRPEYVRALINNERPGAIGETALADRWWDSRTPKRRAAIWRNHAATEAATHKAPPRDQTTIYDVLKESS